MPSGGQPHVDEEVARHVAKVIACAIKNGLLVEWLAFFLGGLAAGQEPSDAAERAAEEWDF